MPKAKVTDIVDRLRYSDIYDYADADALCDEAADEIERLRLMLPRPIDEAPKDREVIGVERPPCEDKNYFHMVKWNEEYQQFMADGGYNFEAHKQIWAFCGVTHFIDPDAVPLLPEIKFDDLEDEQ